MFRPMAYSMNSLYTFSDNSVIEPPEVVVFFDISKMSLCLNGTDLTVSDSFLTLDVCMGSFFQCFPLLIDLHDFIFPGIFFSMIFI